MSTNNLGIVVNDITVGGTDYSESMVVGDRGAWVSVRDGGGTVTIQAHMWGDWQDTEYVITAATYDRLIEFPAGMMIRLKFAAVTNAKAFVTQAGRA